MTYKLLITLIVVNFVSAVTTFIKEGQRPELFELTDNEVPNFKLTLPEEEFINFKNSANMGTVINNKINIIQRLYPTIRGFVEFLSNFHFSDVFPGYNFAEIFPELNIDEEGYANIDTEEIMKELDITKEGLLALDFTDKTVHGDILEKAKALIYKRSPKYNLTRITDTLDTLERAEKYKDSSENNNMNQIVEDTSDDDVEIFKTKNGTMLVEINGEELSFKKVTFSIGGYSGRHYSKLGFNFKIRGDDELFGRTQFRLRSDAREATRLRSKLVCDIQNRLGLPSISANFANLYINDEYMGVYVLMDAYKLSWVEYEYGEENTTSLYQCKTTKNYLTADYSTEHCRNKNDDVTDKSEWVDFLNTLDEAKSAEDIEDIFDVDLFLKQIALEYLLGSWDHFLDYGHNYYLYRPPGDKWKYLTYDFDAEFGQDIELANVGYVVEDVPELMLKTNTDYINYSFEDWAKKTHLIEILILNDPSRFNNHLKDIVNDVFNPAILYSHIDELKSLIRPYIEQDKTPDNDGNYPGRLNKEVGDYSLEEWDANSEFTTIESTDNYRAFGLKFWILAKYRYVCTYYNMDCDPVYMDKNYQYEVNEDLEFKLFGDPSTYLINNYTVSSSTVIENPSYGCIVEMYGYQCCSPDNTDIYFHDEISDWGFDFELNEWCGITPYNEMDNILSNTGNESTLTENNTFTAVKECWAESLGYNCCSECVNTYEIDSNGQWGIEYDQWCGIPTYCDN